MSNPAVTKLCNKCLITKDLSEFHRNNRSRDGRRPDCRACQSIHQHEYYLRTRVLKGYSFKGHDLTGREFGRLVVMYRSGKDRQSKPIWKCRCRCGNDADVRAACLKNGSVQSCGCYQRECARQAVITAIGAIRLPFGVSAARYTVTRYRKDAQERGVAWELTDEQALQLMQQPCVYCGIQPLQRATANKGHGFFLYNGLDRVDPKEGYTVANSKPCCKKCNTAKLNMTLADFKNWIKRIYSNLFRGPHGG